jgi:uncharacterized ParB-like nuclease family protein
VKKLNLNAIRIDGGTQPRESINMEVVGDYAEAVKVGIEFPAIVVFNDGADNWLADGFHRYHAHQRAGKASIVADVRSGTLLDAKLYAVGSNSNHGLRRTNEDKRRAVLMVLEEPAWADWSDRKIADACGVSHPFVAAIRNPPMAAKQQEHRDLSAAKKAGKVESDSTRDIPQSGIGFQPSVESDSTSKGKTQRRDLPSAPPPTAPELAEAQDTITELAQENEALRDRLAVEAMDASEEEKTQAAETIRELRERVRLLEIEVEALKASRDTYMRESAEAKKSAIYWRKQAEKAAKVSA